MVPLIEDDGEIEIEDKDLRVDTYRASGAGGQHINKTDSAIRITHLPTGTVVSCQNERSQHQNRDRAMQMLRAKLADLQRQQQDAKLASLAGEQKKVEWGSQIRSYVLQPYQMVKDERTGHQTSNVEGRAQRRGRGVHRGLAPLAPCSGDHRKLSALRKSSELGHSLLRRAALVPRLGMAGVGMSTSCC